MLYQFLAHLRKRCLMARNTSITLGNHFESFVEREIASGRYASVNEVIRSALRLLETEEQKVEALRNALIEGEDSGMVQDFDPIKHLEQIRAKAKR